MQGLDELIPFVLVSGVENGRQSILAHSDEDVQKPDHRIRNGAMYDRWNLCYLECHTLIVGTLIANRSMQAFLNTLCSCLVE